MFVCMDGYFKVACFATLKQAQQYAKLAPIDQIIYDRNEKHSWIRTRR